MSGPRSTSATAVRPLYAVNRAYAEPGQALADGDEVALIPPVSGGAFRLTEGPVNLTAVVVEVVDEQAGAIATFLGTVRGQSRGREVIALEYEAYEEMAEEVMAEIAAEVQDALRAVQGRDLASHSGGSRSAGRASRSRSRRRTGRTRSRRAPTRSRRSRRGCRSGRRRSTWAARSGSAEGRERGVARKRRAPAWRRPSGTVVIASLINAGRPPA